MALNRVDYPANLTDQADFSAHGTLIETGYLDKSFAPLLVLGGEIPQGIVLQIGGVVYRADSAETVTGSSSKYIRIVPAGATATANYVANLSGVSWSAQYNGYYDGSGNLYIFDENQALYDGAVATVKTRFVQQAEDGKVYVDDLMANTVNATTVNGTSGVFDTVNTGQGANELYPMNQGVRTNDNVTFRNVTVTNSFSYSTPGTRNATWSTPTASGGISIPEGSRLLGWRITKATGAVTEIFEVGPTVYGISSAHVYLTISV